MTRNDERGYTLIELSVAMTVFVAFMAFAMPFLFGNLRQAVQTENRIDLQQNSRAAIRTLVRELRQARELLGSSNKPSGRNKISFTVDLNGDGTIASNEGVTYYVKQLKLYRGPEDEQGQPLAEDIATIEFTYWGSNLQLDTNNNGVVEEAELDQNGNITQWTVSELTNVTRVGVRLVANAQGEEQSYTETVWLRNKVV